MRSASVIVPVMALLLLGAADFAHGNEPPDPVSQQSSADPEPSVVAAPPLYAVVQKNATGIDHSSDGCNPFADSQPLQRGDLVVMVRAVNCPKRIRGDGVFLEVLHEGRQLLATAEDVRPATKDLDALFKLAPNVIEASLASWREDSIRVAGQGKRTEEIAKKKVVEKVRKSESQGVTVLKVEIYDVSEHTDGTGFGFSVYNSSKKVIKYVTATYRGKNAVGDSVLDGFGRSAVKTTKGIGPIAIGETASYSKDYVWLTDTVESLSVDSIKVDFMDGTSRTTPGSNDLLPKL